MSAPRVSIGTIKLCLPANFDSRTQTQYAIEALIATLDAACLPEVVYAVLSYDVCLPTAHGLDLIPAAPHASRMNLACLRMEWDMEAHLVSGPLAADRSQWTRQP